STAAFWIWISCSGVWNIAHSWIDGFEARRRSVTLMVRRTKHTLWAEAAEVNHFLVQRSKWMFRNSDKFPKSLKVQEKHPAAQSRWSTWLRLVVRPTCGLLPRTKPCRSREPTHPCALRPYDGLAIGRTAAFPCRFRGDRPPIGFWRAFFKTCLRFRQ